MNTKTNKPRKATVATTLTTIQTPALTPQAPELERSLRVINAQDAKIANITNRIGSAQLKLAKLKTKLETFSKKKVVLLFPSFKTLILDVIEILDTLDGKAL